MNTKYSREDLLRQLEDVLNCAGANPARWPDECKARLAALVESDECAARRFAEAKALDRVLACAPKCKADAGFEARICAAAFSVSQAGQKGEATVLHFQTPGRHRFDPPASAFRPARAVWGGAAMLAASLLLGIYIGVSGEAVPALRNIEMLASNDLDAGIVFSGSAFEPSQFEGNDQL